MNEFHLDDGTGKLRCGRKAGRVAVVSDLLHPGAVICAECAKGMELWTLHAHAPAGFLVGEWSTSNITITDCSITVGSEPSTKGK